MAKKLTRAEMQLRWNQMQRDAAKKYQLKRRGRYGIQKAKVAGRTFDSGGEGMHFLYLQQREKNGEIKDLRCQVSVYLTKARIQYIVDFAYTLCVNGEEIFEEYKNGLLTPEWRLKKRLWEYYGPAKLIVVHGHDKHETIIPKM